MPKQTYEQKKPHIYKWVETHREQYNELCKIKNRRFRLYHSQARIFRKMLIDLI